MIDDGWRDALTARWRSAWPDAEPVGHLLKGPHHDRWVRFHTLPGSQRYARSATEHREIARRQRAVLGHLVEGERTAPLLVVTSWWWRRPEPPPRMPLRRQFVVPGTREMHPANRAPRRDGHWWRSFREPDTDGDIWTQLRVARRTAGHPSVSALLRLVAQDDAGDVVVTDPEFRWVLAPYDGGLDVLARTTRDRDVIGERFSGWSSRRPDGL